MRVAVFATCLVDLFRPSVGFATVKLLDLPGVELAVPPGQTCCGQPAFNNGDRSSAREIARQVVDTFSEYDYVVIPSGSCAGMLTVHYPGLFDEADEYSAKARALASRCFELSQFLTDILGKEQLDSAYRGRVTYHDSCSCLREMQIKHQPRKLLSAVRDLELAEMEGTENCCGFGGTFCVKYPEISTRMVNDKVRAVEHTGADTLVAADLGCLLNIAGRLKRLGSPVKVFHLAEVLAGMAAGEGIGGGEAS